MNALYLSNESLVLQYPLEESLGKQASGFSIIELLVVIVLSSIMMLGVTKLLSNNIVLVDSTSASSQSLERGNYAAYILARHIRIAGFPNYFSSSAEVSNLTSIAFTGVTEPSLCSLTGSCGVNGVNDTLVLEYDLPIDNVNSGTTGLHTTCNGVDVGKASDANKNVKRIREQFSIVSQQLADNRQASHLACQSFRVEGSGVTALGEQVNVVAGVRNMQVRYGLSNADANVNVGFYTRTPTGTQANLNKRLRAIKFALLVETDSGALAPGNTNFNLLGQAVTIDDERANGYRVYNSTVVLNNGGGQF